MFRCWAFTWLLGAVLVATPAWAEQRLPTIPPDQYTADQKKAAEEFLAARKVPVFGPFEPMMHSPEVMNLARSMGDYLRYHSSVGNTLSELIILITAREWSQDYEWYVHYPIALKAGDGAEVEHLLPTSAAPEVPNLDDEWVKGETEHWLGRRGDRNLIILLTDGKVAWDDARQRFDTARTSAIPGPLLSQLKTEPLYVDLRWADEPDAQLEMSSPRFADAVATIAAELHGKSKDELAGIDVREHCRWRWVRNTGVSAISLLALGMTIAAYYWYDERNRAIAEERIAVALRIENRIEALLFTQGIRKRPSLRSWERDLADLRTGDGREMPRHLLAELNRLHRRLVTILELADRGSPGRTHGNAVTNPRIRVCSTVVLTALSLAMRNCFIPTCPIL